MTVTVVQERPATDARTLIDPELRATLAADVCAKFEDMSEEQAQRGIGQMLAFSRPVCAAPLR